MSHRPTTQRPGREPRALEEKMPATMMKAPEVEDVEMGDLEEAEPEAQKLVEMDSALDEAKEGVVPTGSTLSAAEPVSAPPKGPEVVMFDVARLKGGSKSSSKSTSSCGTVT